MKKFENEIRLYGYHRHFVTKGISKTKFAKILSKIDSNIGGISWIMNRMGDGGGSDFDKKVAEQYPDKIVELDSMGNIVAIYNYNSEKVS